MLSDHRKLFLVRTNNKICSLIFLFLILTWGDPHSGNSFWYQSSEKSSFFPYSDNPQIIWGEKKDSHNDSKIAEGGMLDNNKGTAEEQE